jgi:pimeloyl-ACP methyl ester carboxylesterase
MPSVDADGVEIVYDLEGPAGTFPLVLHHGTAGGGAQWRRAGYVELLAPRARVMVVDARGRGRSGKPHDTAAYGIERHAADVLEVLDAEGVERADVWGWSMGGRVAFELAASHPDRVRGLIVTGATGAGLGPYLEFLLAQAELFRTATMEEAIGQWLQYVEVPGWLREEWLRDDPLALAASNEAIASWGGVTDRLERIGAPALLLVGDREPILEEARQAAARMRRCRLVELEGCDHISAFTRADLAVPHVLAFLGDLGNA